MLYQIAHRSSLNDYYAISAMLKQAGFQDPKPYNWTNVIKQLVADIPNDGWYGWKSLLEPIADLASGVRQSKAELWRSLDLGELFNLINMTGGSWADVKAAQREDQGLLRGWYRAVATAYGINHAAAGAQAAHLLKESARRDERLNSLLFSHTFADPRAADVSQLLEDELSSLRLAITSRLSIVRSTAADLLCMSEDVAVADALERDIDLMSGDSQLLAQLVICACSIDSVAAAREGLRGDDFVRRQGSAWFARSTVADIPGMQEVLSEAADHPDMTIRDRAGVAQSGLELAEYWTCQRCVHVNDMGNFDGSTNLSGVWPVHAADLCGRVTAMWVRIRRW